MRVDQSEQDVHLLALDEVKKRNKVRQLVRRGLGPAHAEDGWDVARRWREATVHEHRIRRPQFESDGVHPEAPHDVELGPRLGGNRRADDGVERIELLQYLPRPIFSRPAATLELHIQSTNR